MRFSIKSLLIAVAAVAVGCVSLLNANGYWAALIYATVLVCLFTAIPEMIHASGSRRAFWSGFAIFGWGYLFLVWVGPVGESELRLPTQVMLVELHEFLEAKQEINARGSPARPRRPSGSGYGGGFSRGYSRGYGRGGYGGGDGAGDRVMPLSDFMKVGDPLCLLLFAFVGGLIGRSLYSRSQREPIPQAEP